MEAREPNFDGSKFAPMEPRVDPGVVLAAMRRDGLAPRLVSEVLRGDREVALAAVRRTGAELQFTASELKTDREEELAAVQQGGGATQNKRPRPETEAFGTEAQPATEAPTIAQPGGRASDSPAPAGATTRPSAPARHRRLRQVATIRANLTVIRSFSVESSPNSRMAPGSRPSPSSPSSLAPRRRSRRRRRKCSCRSRAQFRPAGRTAQKKKHGDRPSVRRLAWAGGYRPPGCGGNRDLTTRMDPRA